MGDQTVTTAEFCQHNRGSYHDYQCFDGNIGDVNNSGEKPRQQQQ